MKASNGQFIKYREMITYAWKDRRKKHVCACCQEHILNGPRKVYCDPCGKYILRLNVRHNTVTKRMRQEIQQWRGIGLIGRIKQQLNNYYKLKVIVKNLKSKLRYYQQKAGDVICQNVKEDLKIVSEKQMDMSKDNHCVANA